MKRTVSFLLALASLVSAHAGVYPTNFNWFSSPPPKRDQVEQGPCNLFAAVAVAEAWDRILYLDDASLDLSEQHLNSACANFGPSTAVNEAFQYMKTNGIVNEAQIPYMNSYTNSQVNAAPGTWMRTFADRLNGTTYSCFAPEKYNDHSPASLVYFVGDYQAIDLRNLYPGQGLSNYDQLKRAILNQGPIGLNMVTHDSLHGSTNHAYCLYGWHTNSDGSTSWVMTDSWPVQYGGYLATYSYTGDLIGAIISNAVMLNSAHVIKPLTDASGAIVNQGVYRMKRDASGNWVLDARTVKGISATSTQNNLYSMTIANPYVSGLAYTTATVTAAPFLDNATITWSYTPDPSTPNAGVSFSSTTGLTTSLKTAGEGYVYVNATYRRPNGLAEVVSKRIYASPGIPFKFVKVSDFCSGTTRYTKYQVQSKMTTNLPPLNITWDFRPGSGATYYSNVSTTTIANDTFNITIYNITSTSYGLLLKLIDPNYSNIQDGNTTGTFVQPCY
jgi:hypothetical protein